MRNKFNFIIITALNFYLFFILTGCTPNVELKETENIKSVNTIFCPFGICKGIDPKTLYENAARRKLSITGHTATQVLPPKPFLEMENPDLGYRGNLFDGIDYDVMFTNKTGVCMARIAAGIEKKNLGKFFHRVNNYLSLNLEDFEKKEGIDNGDKFYWFELKGSKIKHLKSLNEVFLTVYEYEAPQLPFIYLEFWFNNDDACIKETPEIARLKPLSYVP